MIVNIQYLRAFAAINVVIYHIIGTATDYGKRPEIHSFFEGWGENGVDIFFVISGFVMMHSQNINQKDTVSFIYSRLTRIVPIYWILTTVFYLI